MTTNYQNLLFKFQQQGDYKSFIPLYQAALPELYRFIFYRTHGDKEQSVSRTKEILGLAFDACLELEPNEDWDFNEWIMEFAKQHLHCHHQEDTSECDASDSRPEKVRLKRSTRRYFKQQIQQKIQERTQTKSIFL